MAKQLYIYLNSIKGESDTDRSSVLCPLALMVMESDLNL